MEPEIQSLAPRASAPGAAEAATPPEPAFGAEPLTLRPPESGFPGLHQVFIGNQGLRAGWSAVLFILLSFLFMFNLGTYVSLFLRKILHIRSDAFTPASAILGEVIWVLAILAAGSIMALLEHRRIVDYHLVGPHRLLHFFSGLAVGFAALSALVGAMAWGGWLAFGPVALSGAQVFRFGALWSVAFLMTGFFEEGSFRCYLQFTLARGINFWWALALVAAMCGSGFLFTEGQGIWGVYLVAVLGLAPCFVLHLIHAEGAGFWQAAWVTSACFGFIHTGNNGENWIGIFSAAAIGFVFCVSIRVTGSAWWAIGCHAAWDWAETYFYGTADSGLVAQGHYLNTSPAGPVLWSGGTDGPEGSVLILPTVLLLLLAVLVLYGRRKPAALTAPNPQFGSLRASTAADGSREPQTL